MSQLDLSRRPSSPPRERTVRLRSGVPVLPRGDGLVQVGSDPAHRVLLPDTASVRRLLQLLPFGVRTEAPTSTPEVVRALAEAGLLVDQDEERLLAEARRATHVRVHAPAWWRPLADELVRSAGLRVAGAGHDSPADVTLLVTWGEPARHETDRLTSDDEPWLPVAVLERRVRVGPFVVPGQTACLRCVDAHDAGTDPWHQVPPAPSSPPGPDGNPGSASGPAAGSDTLVLRHALLTAVTDLTRWAEGSQPLTWSATRDHRDPMSVEHRSWSRHPHCGCSWGDDLPTG